MKNKTRVVLNAECIQHLYVLFQKFLALVMPLLIRNEVVNLLPLRMAIGETAKAFLPGKLLTRCKNILIKPFGRFCLRHLHDIGHLQRRANTKETMNVIRGAVYDVRLTACLGN